MLYNSIIQAKNGSYIPQFLSGKTLESRYNPEADAEKKTSEISSNTSFIIITGLGSGIIVNKILEKNPEATILIIENSIEDIQFLSKLDSIKSIKNENVIICTIDDFEKKFTSSYIPSLHGNLKIIEQAAWYSEKPENKALVQKAFESAMNKIKADFSVQSHFGKIWQNNIFQNIKYCNSKVIIKPDISKTAVVVAAGPSLDSKIKLLKKERSRFFIIATDTAYNSLSKQGIFCDIVVSLDGQNISVNHFESVTSDTIYFMDLCSSSSAVKKIKKIGGQIVFFNSGHPLSNNLYTLSPSSFFSLNSGSGTVTISALDLAIKLGFENIEVLGADFGYLYGKSYTKGTYLETLYNINSNKYETYEKIFDRLLFRVPLKKRGNSYTTELLENYQTSFEQYLNVNECSYKKVNDVYYIKTSSSSKKTFSINPFCINLNKDFIKTESFLPYISFLRRTTEIQNFDKLYEIALEKALKYLK